MRPSFALAFDNRGDAYLSANDYDRAIADYGQAIRLDPARPAWWRDRGAAYERTGDVRDAIADFDQAIRLDPADPLALNARCWARATTGQALDLALADCNQALGILTAPAIFDSRGLVYFRLNRLDLALADLNTGLKSNPKLAPYLYLRGLTRSALGDVTGGAADIDAAKAIDPQIVDTYARYGIKPPAAP